MSDHLSSSGILFCTMRRLISMTSLKFGPQTPCVSRRFSNIEMLGVLKLLPSVTLKSRHRPAGQTPCPGGLSLLHLLRFVAHLPSMVGEKSIFRFFVEPGYERPCRIHDLFPQNFPLGIVFSKMTTSQDSIT